MMNLHNIVRGAIQSNLPDEEFTLYRSLGQVNDDEGIMTASYSQGETIKGNFQSDSDASLHFSSEYHYPKALCVCNRRQGGQTVGDV